MISILEVQESPTGIGEYNFKENLLFVSIHVVQT